MTPKQAKIVQAIRDLTVNGVGPSYEEIAVKVGVVSRGHVYDSVTLLCEQGVLIRGKGPRSIQIVEAPSRAMIAGLSDAALLSVRAACAAELASRAPGRRASA